MTPLRCYYAPPSRLLSLLTHKATIHVLFPSMEGKWGIGHRLLRRRSIWVMRRWLLLLRILLEITTFPYPQSHYPHPHSHPQHPHHPPPPPPPPPSQPPHPPQRPNPTSPTVHPPSQPPQQAQQRSTHPSSAPKPIS